MNGERIDLGYWSDPLCIWAFVAQSKLDQILREFASRLRVDHRVVPVFGSVPWRLEHGPWASEGVEGRVKHTRRVAQRCGHPEVTGECWRGDAPASSWQVGLAVKAVQLAELRSDVPEGAGAAYFSAIRRAFFERNVNVARRSVQLDVAAELSLPTHVVERPLDDGTAMAALWEDNEERERLRIRGSPTYVFDGGRAMLYGAFPFGVLRATVEEYATGAGPGASPC